MIALDTNILVHAHRGESPWHEVAAAAVKSLAEGREAWALPAPCLHEFLAVVTHPRIWRPSTPLRQAIAQVEAWLGSPRVVVLSHGDGYWATLASMLLAGKSAGPVVHDAHVAALCMYHRVSELWTADRDFSRFPGITTKNPLVG
ncbi:MAG: type II toxin-antitoxin system VapC family toxin [Anaeromyxobacteraceae bacterium]